MSQRSRWTWRFGPALLVFAITSVTQGPLEAIAQSRNGFSAPGLVEPAGGVLSIGTAATGVIANIVAGPGEHVRQGQELVRIDCSPLESQVKSLASQALAARAVAERVRNGPRQEDIAVGEANLGVAKARAEEAADALRRAQLLQVGISVTQAAFLQIQRDARITAAQVEDARAKLELLRSGSREEDIAEADAKRDSAIAVLEEAKARLGQCAVASPIDGVVVARFASVGQLVSTAEPMVLMQIEDDRKMDLRVDVDAAHFTDLCLGQHASAAAPGGSVVVVAALVDRISPSIDSILATQERRGEAAPSHVTATLKLDHQSAAVFPGERVTVRFEPCQQ